MQAKKEELGRYKQRKQACEKTARSLRRQIEQLRGQLSRYAEALEEDLTRGRNQVAERTREGLKYERGFRTACNTLLENLRDKPECRDLLPDLLESGDNYQNAPDSSDGSYSRRNPRESARGRPSQG